jgi:3-hydroxyacyl-CoA dehydrogenase
MFQSIQTAAVLGSGVMGAQIAAHLANCGIDVTLLDIVPEKLTKIEESKGLTLENPRVRNRLATEGKRRLKKMKPSPVTSDESLHRITTGNMEDDMEKLHGADWIIEAVTENLDVKKRVLTAIDHYRKKEAIVSTNTSGISIHQMVEDCSDCFKKHFIGTHFFNPPRYLKLVEIIPSAFTDENVVSFMRKFIEDVLGKGVVLAKDTPNFIANRIGTYGLLVTVNEMIARNLTVGEVDSVTGPLIGRPKSATFRTLDVVGLDTFSHVAENIVEKTEGAEKEAFQIPAFFHKLVKLERLGAKTGQGFYKKENGKILELDLETFSYRERKKLKTPAIETAQRQQGAKRKIKEIVGHEGDRASDFIWSILKQTLLYTAEVFSHIASDIPSVDQAMRWGFGWELGPFEIWDVLGIEHSVKRMKAEGETIPTWLTNFLEKGNSSFYKIQEGNVYYYDPEHGSYKQQFFNEKEIYIHLLKEEKAIIKQNSGASLLEMGDGVALLEFHSKSNAIGLDILHMVNESIEEVEKNYEGLVIGNQGKKFSVGANLAWMLMEAQDENFDELYLVIKKFQETAMAIKYASKPVVAAPFQMTLGGGAEIVLPAASIQAAQEAYIGLVETGVGLIPGGGGTKELYLKQLRNLPRKDSSELIPLANKVFETVATAKTSTSAEEARSLGFLNQADGISSHPDHLLFDAKERVIALAKSNYRPPTSEKIPVPGKAGYGAMLMGAKTMQYGGYASAHDVKIAEKLAYVLSGGKVREGTRIEEQTMLALEREAFLSLLGEPLTQARMQHMLLKGKPLRN